jgi:signal transduction histidine kinase
MKAFNSIKFRLTSGISFLIIAITVLLSVLSYEHERKAIQNRIYAQLNATADLKKELVVNYVDERINDLRTIATAEHLRNSIFSLLDKKTDIQKTEEYRYISQRLRSLKNINRDYLSIEVVDLKGNIIVSSNDSHSDSNHRHKHEHKGGIGKYLESIKRGSAVIMQDYLDSETRHLDFAIGIKDRDGSVRAVTVSSIVLKDTIFAIFSDYTGLGHTGETLLVRLSNGSLMHINPTRHSNILKTEAHIPSSEHFKLGISAASGKEGMDEGIDYRGKKVIGAYRHIPALGWGIVAKIDADEAFKEIKTLRKRIFISSIWILGIMLVATYLITRRFTAPIIELTRKTRSVASGDYAIRIKSERKDEIGDLEKNFDEMVEALDKAKTEIENKQRELEEVNYDLERKVRERTQELSDANTALLKALENIKKETAEKKKLEEMLLHSQKMEAIGQLAGGIAHDFNNMLSAIIGFGGLINMNMSDDDPNRTYLKEILAAGERASHLTQGLLTFSRKQIINPKPVSLNEIIRSIEKLLKRIIREDIELKTILADRDLTVMADPGQIEQVLMNLTTNARDAMPHGGILTISTELIRLDNEFIKTHGYGETREYALISVSDTGMGMDEKTKERIFEPFFTTKELGKGTGLGLAIVYGIIKQHNGYINCYSEPCKGTTFRIYMPLISPEFEKIQPAAVPELKGGSETVLVAEDDTVIRKLTRSVLERFGYKVIEAFDGEDAIRKFMDNKNRIHILLFDVIMPKKNGKEAYEEIKKIRPDIKSIFISGYTADIIHEKGILDEGMNFISKPVSPRDILRKVREVLDR